MSRPLAFSGFSFMCGCVLACVLLHLGFGFNVLGALAAVILLAVVLSLVIFKNKNKMNTAVLSFLGLALLLCFFHGKFLIEPAYSFADGEEYEISGTVENVTYYDSSARLTLKSDEVGKFNLYVPIVTVVDVGDSFEGTFTFEKNTAEISSAISDGVYLSAEKTSLNFEKSENKNKLLKIRELFGDRLYCCFDSLSAKVSEAVVTGNRSFLSSAVADSFKSAGAYHVLVVSGMHLALAASFVMFLFGLLPISRKTVYILEMIFVFFYMLVTGFGVSVVRAGIMLFVCTIGKISGSRYDPITSVMFAATLMLLQNPFALLGLSFVYSFAAVFGIEVFYPEMMGFLEKYIKKLPYFVSLAADALFSVILMSISANIMLLPFEMLFGMAEPIRSVVSGTLLCVPSTAVVTIGLVFACLPHGLHFLILPLRLIMALAVRVCLLITDFASKIPSVTVSLFAPCACFLMAALILLGMILVPKRKALTAVFCSILFVFMSFAEICFAKNSSFLIICTGAKGFSVASVQNCVAEIVVTDNSTVSDMKDALQKIHCDKVSVVILRDGISGSAWSDVSKTGYLKSASRSYDMQGLRISVLLDENKDVPNCDVLVTRSLTGKRRSECTFTIAASGDIIKDNLSSAAEGRYLLAEEDKTMIIEVKNNSLYFI